MRLRLPLLCALACLAAAAPTAGAAGWVLPATTLAPVANGPGGAVVAVDPAGDAAAAWTGDDGPGRQTLVVATRPAGGGWSAPATLATDVGVDAPAVALDAAGNATVVWVESADGSAYAARAARHAAGAASWGAPHDLPASGTADPQTQVRADAAGNAIAAWVEHDAGTGVAFVRAAVEDASGAWGAPATVSDPSDASAVLGRPQIAPDASGGALVGWTASSNASPGDFAVQTSTLGGGWQPPRDVATTSGETISPVRLVGLDGGDVAASWSQDVAPTTLWGGLRSGGAGTWTVDQLSDDVAVSCQPLQAVGADAGGGATVVWKAQSSDGLDSRRLTSGGPEPLVPLFGSLTESAQDVAIDRGTVVFVAHDAGTDADSVLASRRTAGGDWSAPALLASADADTSLAGPDLATDGAGDALASWTAVDGLGATSVAAAAFQAAGPQLGDVSVPTSGVAGEPLALSADARSTFASVAQTSWDFGDGSAPAVGAAVAHAYAAAGTYTVTVTATDSVGNASQATRQVTVAAAPAPPVTPPGTPPPTVPKPPGGGPTPRARGPAPLLHPAIGAPRGVLVLPRTARTLAVVVRNRDAARLRGLVTLVRPRSGRRPALTLATLHGATFAASRRTTVALRLSDQALRALQRAAGHRLPVRLTLRLRAADGRGVTAGRSATLDAAARFGAAPHAPPPAHMSC